MLVAKQWPTMHCTNCTSAVNFDTCKQLLEWTTIMQLVVAIYMTTYRQVHDALHLWVVGYLLTNFCYLVFQFPLNNYHTAEFIQGHKFNLLSLPQDRLNPYQLD